MANKPDGEFLVNKAPMGPPSMARSWICNCPPSRIQTLVWEAPSAPNEQGASIVDGTKGGGEYGMPCVLAYRCDERHVSTEYDDGHRHIFPRSQVVKMRCELIFLGPGRLQAVHVLIHNCPSSLARGV